MTRLRVLTYNIDSGGTKRVGLIHAVLKHADADVIALTEADDPHVVATLADRLCMQHVWERGSGDRHIATLSRFPITAHRIYNSPPLTQAALETTVEVAPHVLTVYNIHFLPYLLLPFEIRRWQAVGRLWQIIHAQTSGPHAIVGDLNAIAAHDRVLQRNNPARMQRVMALQLFIVFRLAIPRLMRAGYTDCYRRMHPREDGFTWMPGNRTTRYDYILADAQLAQSLRACRVVDEIDAVQHASDHLPVLAEFEWSVR